MQFKTWQEMFKNRHIKTLKFDEKGLQLPNDHHGQDNLSVEELYQHFKARLMDEVVAEIRTKVQKSPFSYYYETEHLLLKDKEE